MKVRYLSTLAAAAGMAVGTFAAEPARLPATTATVSSNQQLANTIADTLVNLGVGDSADLTVIAEAGVVTVTGTAKDAEQRTQVLNAIQHIPGVAKIRDGINIASNVTPVQNIDIPGLPTAGPSYGPLAAIPTAAVPPSGSEPLVDPIPLGMAGGGAADLGAPPLPPYAWPTYAPHNNVSRVAYPTAYPYNAFPFIGPFYPFPKVPLGWRKVMLEWEDGHWWIGKVQSPQDYWRVRFW